eukprot:g708.t1
MNKQVLRDAETGEPLNLDKDVLEKHRESWWWGSVSSDRWNDAVSLVNQLAQEKQVSGPSLQLTLATVIQMVRERLLAGTNTTSSDQLFIVPKSKGKKYYPKSVRDEDPNYFIREYQLAEEKAKKTSKTRYPFDRKGVSTKKRRRNRIGNKSNTKKSGTNWVRLQDAQQQNEHKRFNHLLALMEKEQYLEIQREKWLCAPNVPTEELNLRRIKVAKERGETADMLMRILQEYKLISGFHMADYLQASLRAIKRGGRPDTSPLSNGSRSVYSYDHTYESLQGSLQRPRTMDSVAQSSISTMKSLNDSAVFGTHSASHSFFKTVFDDTAREKSTDRPTSASLHKFAASRFDHSAASSTSFSGYPRNPLRRFDDPRKDIHYAYRSAIFGRGLKSLRPQRCLGMSGRANIYTNWRKSLLKKDNSINANPGTGMTTALSKSSYSNDDIAKLENAPSIQYFQGEEERRSGVGLKGASTSELHSEDSLHRMNSDGKYFEHMIAPPSGAEATEIGVLKSSLKIALDADEKGKYMGQDLQSKNFASAFVEKKVSDYIRHPNKSTRKAMKKRKQKEKNVHSRDSEVHYPELAKTPLTKSYIGDKIYQSFSEKPRDFGSELIKSLRLTMKDDEQEPYSHLFKRPMSHFLPKQ